MVKLTKEDVIKLAQLAKLQLNEDEIDAYSEELSAILGYVEQLGTADTNGLTPTAQITGLVNVTREDELIDYGTTPDELLKNAPATKDHLIKVKRMLG